MRRNWLLAATLAIAFPSFATDTTAPVARSAGAPVPLLWKVSDKDNSVYLLGSFHMLTKDDYPLSKDIDAAYADAEEVVFELAPREMLSKDLGLAMTQAALRTDGSKLDDDLSPALRARLAAWLRENDAALKQMGLMPEMFQLVDAWYASLLVTIAQARAAGVRFRTGSGRAPGQAGDRRWQAHERARRRHEAARDVRRHEQGRATATDGRIARRA